MLVHADFALDNSRTSIPPNAYNVALLKIAAAMIVDTIAGEECIRDYPDFYKFLTSEGEGIDIGDSKTLKSIIWSEWEQDKRLKELLKKVYQKYRDWPIESYNRLFQMLQKLTERRYGEHNTTYQERIKPIQRMFCSSEIFIVPIKHSGLTFLPLPDGRNGIASPNNLFFRSDSLQNRPLRIGLLEGIPGLKISSFEGLNTEGLIKNRIVKEFSGVALLEAMLKIQDRELPEYIRENLFAFAYDLAGKRENTEFNNFFDTGPNSREERLLGEILVPVKEGGWAPALRSLTPKRFANWIDTSYFRAIDEERCLSILCKNDIDTEATNLYTTLEKMGVWNRIFPLKWEIKGTKYVFSLPWISTPEDRTLSLKKLVNRSIQNFDKLAQHNDIYNMLKKEPWFYAENIRDFTAPENVFLFNSGDVRKLTLIAKENRNNELLDLYRAFDIVSIEQTSEASKLCSQLSKMALSDNFGNETGHAELYRALTYRLSRLDEFKTRKNIPVLCKNNNGYHYRDKEKVWFAATEYKRHKHIFSDYHFAYFDDDIRAEYVEYVGVNRFRPEFRIEYTNEIKEEDVDLKKCLEQDHLPVLLTLADDYQGSEFKKEDIMDRWQYLKIFKDPNVKMVMNMAGEDKIVISTEAPNVDVLYRPVSIAIKDSDKSRIGELAHDLIDPPAKQNLNFSKFGPALADGVFRNMALSELFSSYLTYTVLDSNANSSLLVKRFLNEKGITDHDLATAKMFIGTRLLTVKEWSFFINHMISLVGKVGFDQGDWSDYKNYQLKGLRFSSIIDGFEKGSKFIPLLEQINPLSGNRIELEKNRKMIQAMFFLTNDKRRKLTDEQFSEKIKEKLDGYDFFTFDLTDYYNDFKVVLFDEELIFETMFDLENDLTGLSPVVDSVHLIEAHTSTDPAFQTKVDNINPENQEQIKRAQHKRGLALEVKLARLEAQKLIAIDYKAVLNAVKLLFQSEQRRVVSEKIPEYLNYIESLLRLDHVTLVQMEKVLHVSKQIGDGLGYDILIPRMEDSQINVYRVEVKSATGNNHKIYISENERRSILGFVQEPNWRLWLNGESPLSLTEQVKEYVKKHNDQLTELKEKKELYLSADQWMVEFRSK